MTSGGTCGLSIPDLQIQSEIPHDELKLILRELYDGKYFKVREGINGKLVFKIIKSKKPAQ